MKAYDLQTRTLEASYQIPGASTLSMAADTGDMYVGTTGGQIWRIDVNALDYVRLGTQKAATPAVALSTQTGFPITHLYAGSPPLILAGNATADWCGRSAGDHRPGHLRRRRLRSARRRLGDGDLQPWRRHFRLVGFVRRELAASALRLRPARALRLRTPPSIAAEASPWQRLLNMAQTDVDDAISALAAAQTSRPCPSAR